MSTQVLAKLSETLPSVFDDFFEPWNEWFDGGLPGCAMKVPAVNITEQKDKYMVSLAAPGLKKEDFKIDVDGNMLTVSTSLKQIAVNQPEMVACPAIQGGGVFL